MKLNLFIFLLAYVHTRVFRKKITKQLTSTVSCGTGFDSATNLPSFENSRLQQFGINFEGFLHNVDIQLQKSSVKNLFKIIDNCIPDAARQNFTYNTIQVKTENNTLYYRPIELIIAAPSRHSIEGRYFDGEVSIHLEEPNLNRTLWFSFFLTVNDIIAPMFTENLESFLLNNKTERSRLDLLEPISLISNKSNFISFMDNSCNNADNWIISYDSIPISYSLYKTISANSGSPFKEFREIANISAYKNKENFTNSNYNIGSIANPNFNSEVEGIIPNSNLVTSTNFPNKIVMKKTSFNTTTNSTIYPQCPSPDSLVLINYNQYYDNLTQSRSNNTDPSNTTTSNINRTINDTNLSDRNNTISGLIGLKVESDNLTSLNTTIIGSLTNKNTSEASLNNQTQNNTAVDSDNKSVNTNITDEAKSNKISKEKNNSIDNLNNTNLNNSLKNLHNEVIVDLNSTTSNTNKLSSPNLESNNTQQQFTTKPYLYVPPIISLNNGQSDGINGTKIAIYPNETTTSINSLNYTDLLSNFTSNKVEAANKVIIVNLTNITNVIGPNNKIESKNAELCSKQNTITTPINSQGLNKDKPKPNSKLKKSCKNKDKNTNTKTIISNNKSGSIKIGENLGGKNSTDPHVPKVFKDQEVKTNKNGFEISETLIIGS